jgi:hypothetical protein
VLRSNPTPTFSHTAPSTYTPSYKVPDTWDCLTIVSEFSDTVPAHPFDILPHLALEPVDLGSLLRSCVTPCHKTPKGFHMNLCFLFDH